MESRPPFATIPISSFLATDRCASSVSQAANGKGAARVPAISAFPIRLLDQRLGEGGQDDLVFRSPMGDPLRSSNYRSKIWLPSVEEMALDFPYLSGLRVHDLRHTAASLAISCGANIKVIQRMLGHRHASMTLDRYGHLYTEDLEEVADRLNALFIGVA